MNFEYASELVHDLSELLSALLELEGELVLAPPGSQAKAIQDQINEVKSDIKDLASELLDGGLKVLID